MGPIWPLVAKADGSIAAAIVADHCPQAQADVMASIFLVVHGAPAFLVEPYVLQFSFSNRLIRDILSVGPNLFETMDNVFDWTVLAPRS